ncbi:amino acid transporter [Mangrovibacterium marinum]|uniref:Amino acid transporter n=1 Tax=Mangrovibacterium marinum TaxID=1639118 RepID=A0A2T5BX72_9BACT|nr:amino acid permease [Mangrovibacterium marinum]PTN04619.1 amino acid transporter [Mangrovibacterium marinum]
MAGKNRLKKELGLFDVFSISTGAMFSSGFFLLPGLASQFTGPSVFVGYLLAAILIVPSMFSMAEIATALPRSGGAYFFLDRSLGPLFGTIGGLGTYLALVFKTAFALVGIGAYAAIFWDIPIKTIAIAATFIFMAFNLVGAKKTSRLQNFFVVFLLIVLVVFIIDGLYRIYFSPQVAVPAVNEHFSPFLTHGLEGLITTAGFVFVSYLGLTKIASVAEEIRNPERNIPLGMLLSLVVTGAIYVLGVFVMVSLIEPTQLASDLAPAATAVKQLFKWIPDHLGTYLMIGAAMAAFASTGNAGLLSSSRYPFAMGRDKLLPPALSRVGKRGSPYLSILITAALVIVFILVLSEEGIAKMASTFNLIIFMLINFAVIVFRKSNIQSYDPGFKSPLFPLMQIAGILISFVLIAYMGWPAVLFSLFIILVAALWYYYYARAKVKREGAIYHWFALLGQHQHTELENEFMIILKEKGLRQGDPFDETIIKSTIFRLDEGMDFETLVEKMSEQFSRELDIQQQEVQDDFLTASTIDTSLTIAEVAVLFAKLEEIDVPTLYIVLADQGIRKPVTKGNISGEDTIKVFFFLVSPAADVRMQLRMLSRIVSIVEREGFVSEILAHSNHRKIKEYLLQNERFITVQLLRGTLQAEMIGKPLKEIKFPPDVLVALVERNQKSFPPHGNTVLEERDILTIIGEPTSISKLFESYMTYI